MELPDPAMGLNVPPALAASINRHRAHVEQLATSLRAAGMPDAQIEASVSVLIASYRSELIPALKSLMKADPDAH